MKEVFDSIIDKLEDLHAEYINQYGVVGSNPRASAVSRCIRTVEEVQEEYNGGWIPCSERLPEVSGEYYSYVYYDGHYMYSVDEIDCDGMFKKWNCTSDYKVVAWKPIEPYQPEGENELYRAKSVDGDYQEYKGDWK